MIQDILSNLTRPFEIYYNGTRIADLSQVPLGAEVKIVLPSVVNDNQVSQDIEYKNITPTVVKSEELKVGHTYKIKVKAYMTRKATPEFNFMKTWNDDKPMPLREMVGEVLKTTRGMVRMRLHGNITQTTHCIRCGRVLTHPISKLYGLGPECGSHFYINPFETEKDLLAAIDDIKAKLQSVTWTGWIIKSAIERAEEVFNE